MPFDFNFEQMYSPTITHPLAQYQPTYAPKKSVQLDYAYAPSVFIESPGSTGATVTTKKEANLSGDVAPSQGIAPLIGSDTTQNDPMGTIMILGLVAVGGYVLVKYMNKRKK